MAKIFVLGQQNNQVGSVDFVFTGESTESYLFLDINANYAAKFHLQKSRVLDSAGKAIASLVCGSDGKVANGNVVPPGKSYPTLGLIRGSQAEVMVEGGHWRRLGGVTQNYVTSDTMDHVGELSMHWGSEDEVLYQRLVKACASDMHPSADRAQVLSERLRPDMYQNMMNLAGGAALIMRLFERKKHGWFG
jgi:hypothetical protein